MAVTKQTNQTRQHQLNPMTKATPPTSLKYEVMIRAQLTSLQMITKISQQQPTSLKLMMAPAATPPPRPPNKPIKSILQMPQTAIPAAHQHHREIRIYRIIAATQAQRLAVTRLRGTARLRRRQKMPINSMKRRIQLQLRRRRLRRDRGTGQSASHIRRVCIRCS